MKRLLSAFRNSMAGLGWAIRHEAAVRQEAILLAIGVPLAFLLTGDGATRLMLIGGLALLMAVELLNTAIEKLADFITLDRDPRIGLVKDLGSAAVFVLIVLNGTIWAWAVLSWLLR
ncbi:MAG TPA: diacylglycerol kinase [Beijerinckiaceae bacterium]|nr:diacylglycerol kinase [Beijerinckiaceae bacterium]